jgi:hypothetical protein
MSQIWKWTLVPTLWLLLAAVPAPGAGNGKIKETSNPNDCETIYTGSGLVTVEICVKNKGGVSTEEGEEGNDCDAGDFTMTLSCADGNPTPLTIGVGETKCSVCKIKSVVLCDHANDCEGLWEYSTQVFP